MYLFFTRSQILIDFTFKDYFPVLQEMLTTVLLNFLLAWGDAVNRKRSSMSTWGVNWKQKHWRGQLDLGLSYVPLQGL